MDSNKAESEASEMNGAVEVMVEKPNDLAGKADSTNKIDIIEAKDAIDKIGSRKSDKIGKSERSSVTINADDLPSTSSSNPKAISYSQELAARRKQFMSQPSTVATRRQQAVCVRRAHKNYGPKNNPNVVLDGLNMTVPKGSMYVIPHDFFSIFPLVFFLEMCCSCFWIFYYNHYFCFEMILC